MRKVEKGGMDKNLGFTVTEGLEDGTERKFYFVANRKSERDKWLSDLNGMVTAAQKLKAIARSHQGKISKRPIQNAEAELYTEGKTSGLFGS